MNKKIIMYVVGGVAIIGIAYYLMNRKKSVVNTTEQEDDLSDVKPIPRPVKQTGKEPVKSTSDTEIIAEDVNLVTAKAGLVKILTDGQIEKELQMRCGKKPKLKKNISLWNVCRANLTTKLKSQRLVGFDGTYDGVVSNDFFSSFNSNFDLNL